MMDGPAHVMLVAGETSGDALGGALMKALKELVPDAQFTGAGGLRMEAEGLASIFPIADTSVMGPREIIPRLPLIFRRIRETVEHALQQRPDVVVIIDSPDFTHRVARRIAQHAPDIPIINYAAPTIWAWRPGRADAMAKYLTRVLALLPFEPDFFRTQAGLDCVYVGHPVIEQVPAPGAGVAFRNRHNMAPDDKVLLVLPGSRMNEARRLTALFGEAVQCLQNRVGELKIVVPVVPHLHQVVEDAVHSWPRQPIVIQGNVEKWAAFDAADAALAASGTVALELGLVGVPMVIAYKIDRIAGWLVSRLLKVPSVVLPNLILDRPSVREFLQGEGTPANIADALQPLLSDTVQRRRALRDFQEMKELMGVGGDAPSVRAARAVMEVLER